MEPISKTYSPYWALQFLILCLGFWVVFQLYETNRERVENLAAADQLFPQGKAAVEAKKQFLALVEDLNQTAQIDPAAAQILKEFKIQVQKNPNASKK